MHSVAVGPLHFVCNFPHTYQYYVDHGKQAQLNQILDEGGKLATIKVKVAKSTPATSSAFVPPNRVAGMRQRIGRNKRNTQPTL
ncbi:hypothetical protein PF003_g9284 [Phytophthora fragariae]|nr:hypothetical protein PF003_g9284 [Phytophthora fragariae]